jgi:oligopeptidase B
MTEQTPHATSSAPIAPRRPHSFTHHGITIEDPYAWLRDAGYPEVTDGDVLDYLKAENAHLKPGWRRMLP